MIDQQKFHHRLAHRQNFRALRQHRHTLGHLGVAGDLQLGHFFDFDTAHAAIAGDRQLRVITIVRNRHVGLGSRLDNGLALGGDDFFAVNRDFYRVHGNLEYWSVGVMEWWAAPPQGSITPLPHHSILTVHRCSATWASNSSRNLRMNAPGGQAAASPNGQIVLPAMLPAMLRTRSKSPFSPWPFSMR